MEFIKEWLQQVLIVLVLAAFFDMLIPHNSMHKYMKLVISLCILLTLLAPVVRWVGGDAREWLASELQQQFQVAAGRDMPHQVAAQQVAAQANNLVIEQTESLVEQRLAVEVAAFLRNLTTRNAECALDATFEEQSLHTVESVWCTTAWDAVPNPENHRALEERLRQFILENWHAEAKRIEVERGETEVES